MATDIETRLRQGPEVSVSFPDLEGLLPVRTQLVHLTQYHEDGTQSDYYGIELWEEHFNVVKKTIVESGISKADNQEG